MVKSNYSYRAKPGAFEFTAGRDGRSIQSMTTLLGPARRLLHDGSRAKFSHQNRQYPAPHSPWIMKQVWHDLLFAHWPVPVDALRALVPECLEIDTFDDTAWIGVVPFTMNGVRPRGIPPLPYLSAFPELNVRTYVRNADRAGVFFFSLDAANLVAVHAARLSYLLPYYHARMTMQRRDEWYVYSSIRRHPAIPGAELKARYRAIGHPSAPMTGSREYWLTERYCLYTVSPRGVLYRCEIHHDPWPLQAAEAEFETNTMASASGITLPDFAPLLHFSQIQEVFIWPLRRCVPPQFGCE